MYTSLKCRKCGKETILITEEVDSSLREGRYISCSHCGSKNVIKKVETDDLRQCMGHGAWKKSNGKIRQVR